MSQTTITGSYRRIRLFYNVCLGGNNDGWLCWVGNEGVVNV